MDGADRALYEFILRVVSSPHFTGSSNCALIIIVNCVDEQDPAVAARVQLKAQPGTDLWDSFSSVLAGVYMHGCLQSHTCGDPFRWSEETSTSRDGQASPNREQDDQASSLSLEGLLDSIPSYEVEVTVRSEAEGTSDTTVEDRGSTSVEVRRMLDCLPARLIHLSAFGKEETADARLIEIKTLGRAQRGHYPYATLSYCWGPQSEQMYKTTTKTLELRKDRIRWEDLPPVFKDAIRVARGLDVPFLWIDAICILQDSAEDWERESMKMGGIYATGYVTIAADVGNSVNEGFLDIPLTEAEEGLPYLTKITSTLESGQQSTLVFWNAHSVMHGNTYTPPAIEHSPLSQRAWCMQERMLSPRTLHFTRKGLIWECRKMYLAVHMISTVDEPSMALTLPAVLQYLENGIEGGWGMKFPPIEQLATREQLLDMGEDKFDLYHQIFATGAAGYGTHGRTKELETGKQGDFVSWWNRNIVPDYTSRQVTFEKDRLPAISAAARLFDEYIQSPYLAGIWLAELEEGLEWRRGGPTWSDEKLAKHPQFSWTSHPGRVEYPDAINVRGHGKAFDIISYQVNQANKDPYGEIKSAELVLHGHVRRAYLSTDSGNNSGSSYRIQRFLLDKENRVKIGEVDLDLDYSREILDEGVFCFMLYKHSVGYPRFLLLSKDEACSDKYLRIGIGFVQRQHASWLIDSETQSVCLK